MNRIFIVTGADGFLGNNVVRELQGCENAEIRCLVQPGSGAASLDGLRLVRYTGDVTDPDSLKEIFTVPAGVPVYVIHCAGIVEICSGYDPAVYDVNVIGTRNVARRTLGIQGRLVYVSSVHAMAPGKGESPMGPARSFDADTVAGLYAKTKAAAARIVQDTVVEEGLDAVILQLSGLIGPNDYSGTNMTEFFTEVCNRKLPACVGAGYNFVDVRDAARAVVSACTRGVSGQTYLVAGTSVSMMKLAEMAAACNGTPAPRVEVPLWLLDAVTPVTDLYYRTTKRKALFTSFALHTLETDSDFDVSKTVETLDFRPRPLEDTIRDTVAFLRSVFRIDTNDVITPEGPQPVIRSRKGLYVGLAAAAVGLHLLRKAGR